MLVLTRNRDEEVIIDTGSERIRVCVVDIRGDKIRLGFDAPKHVTIHRLEVQEAVDRRRKGGAA
jgi:carbon storage regulator